MGLPLFLLAVLCLLWTTWLFILTVAPNFTAHYLMNTKVFDSGSFGSSSTRSLY